MTRPSPDQSATELLVALCQQWLEACATGTPVSPADLCRDRPDLLPDLERAIQLIECVGASQATKTFRPTEDTSTSAAPAADRPAWPPARIGEYRVVREIGHGGMGVVLEVHDERLNRRVAVKLLGAAVVCRPDAAARFVRESRAAAAVEHDNVVPILHVGDHDGAPFLVMPLLRGESLGQRLKRDGRLDAAEVARVGRDIAAGLAAAHARGVVHRDIKPSNVWLDEGTGRARVLDFGLARPADGTDPLTQLGALLGTPPYMAPEQIDGRPTTPRADLFSLGATLYECATGHKAFDAPTVTAILRAVADHNPTPPARVRPDIPPALSDLILRLLAKNPADRPATAAEVQGALTDWTGETTLPWREESGRTGG